MAHIILSEAAVGRTFPPSTSGVTAERFEAVGRIPMLYAAHLAEEACAVALADGAVVAGPKLSGRWLPGRLDITMGEAQVAPGDWITTIARVSDVGDGAHGEELVIDTASQNQRGELFAQARSTFWVAAVLGADPNAGPPIGRPISTPADTKTRPAIFDFVSPTTIEAPSGHKSGESLSRVVPLADAMRGIAGAFSPRFRRLTVDFTKEIFSGITVITHGRRRALGPGTIAVDFEMIARRGERILSDGRAEILE